MKKRKHLLQTALLFLSLLIFNNSIVPESSGADFPHPPVEIDPPFYASDTAWVDSLMANLTLEEKIAQMLMVQAYSNRDENHTHDLEKLIKKHKIGGVIFFQGGPVRQAMMTNRFQSVSEIPLLIAMDAEWGLGMRLDSTISYPRQMMLGAIRDNQLIYRMGQELAGQLHMLGVHINFAPVADVILDKDNWVIGTRAFGSDRENVAQKTIAYFRGMQDHGVLVTAKHFPGHGDTDKDSHFTLPLISHQKQRLDSVELYPFRKAIQSGVSGVMPGHLELPALDPRDDRASSVSRSIVTGLLKEELGFRGLVVTDALTMRGVTDYFDPGDLEVEAVIAGNDILLMPSDVPKVIHDIKKAVRQERISEAQIDASCRKILMAKSWLGLQQTPEIGLDSLTERLNAPEFQALNHELTEQALTLVKNEGGVLPYTDLTNMRPVTINCGISGREEFHHFADLYKQGRHFFIPGHDQLVVLEQVDSVLADYTSMVVNVYGLDSRERDMQLIEGIGAYLDSLVFDGDVILNFFSYPWSVERFGSVDAADAILISYTSRPLNQQYAAQAIFGASALSGKLPVGIDTLFKTGSGEKIPASRRLKYSIPERVNMRSDTLARIERIVKDAIGKKAMPGCQVLVARKGEVIYHKAFGHHTFRKRRSVTTGDIYDLASVTKIASTVPSLIRLQARGLFDPDDSLGVYFSEMDTSAKAGLVMREILAHQAGLQSWIPFYTNTVEVLDTSETLFSTKFSYTYPHRMGPAAFANRNIVYKDSVYANRYEIDFPVEVADGLYLRRDYQDSIYQWILKSPLGEKKYLYSDLGYYYMYRIVENLTDTLFYPYTWYNFYGPLGAETTGFLPLNRFDRRRIVPTENDMVFRKQLVHGHVHDPGTAMLGGVAGHAGLFSNANDLAKVMQMYLNNGYYGGIQYLDSAILSDYTRCQFCENENRRGMGFDRPMEEEDEGPAANEVSSLSFGHSGFTGTLVWMDPEYDLLYIFLSNRIQPDQDNTKLISMNVRTNIQQVIYHAMKDYVYAEPDE